VKNIQRFRFQSHDFDEISASLSRWNQTYRQLSAGIFFGNVDYLQVDGMEIFELHWGQMIHYQGLTPPGTIGFGLPLTIEGESRYLNHSISNGELLIQRSGSEGDLVGSRNFVIQVLTVNEQRFLDKVEQITGLDSRPLLQQISTIKLNPAVADMLRQKFHAVTHQTITDDSMKSQLESNLARQAEKLLEDIARIVLSSGNDKPPRIRLMRQRELVRMAKDYIWSQPSLAPRTDTICKVLGASERSLRDAFKTCTGMSAGAYIKTFRLNQVRTLLKSRSPESTLVQDAAHRWGFSHMGQFAADYKLLFGENPSETLSKT